jgi:hypothetical protein
MLINFSLLLLKSEAGKREEKMAPHSALSISEVSFGRNPRDSAG